MRLDEDCFRVGGIPGLVKDNHAKWKRLLRAGLKRSDVGAALLVLDGDPKKLAGKTFCPVEAARRLAEASREVGAGAKFSAAVVFARQEFESWLLAGVDWSDEQALAGLGLQRDPQAIPPAGDWDESPRDAKGAIRRMLGAYNATTHQGMLASLVDLNRARASGSRSFRRLESAARQLVSALRAGQPTATP